MANLGCFKPLQGATFRVTALDECGSPLYDECSYAVSDGQTQIEITPNTTEGTSFQQLNAAGESLINQRARTVLNWFDYQIIMGVKDPELFYLMTGAERFLDYGGKTAGNFITEENYATGEFALEIWLGTAEEECVPGAPAPFFGYILLPWTVDGKLSDSITITNDLVTYTFSGRSRKGNRWGDGPYDVMLNASNVPSPLTEPISSDTHYLDLFTQYPPPEPDCGCLQLMS